MHYNRVNWAVNPGASKHTMGLDQGSASSLALCLLASPLQKRWRCFGGMRWCAAPTKRLAERSPGVWKEKCAVPRDSYQTALTSCFRTVLPAVEGKVSSGWKWTWELFYFCNLSSSSPLPLPHPPASLHFLVTVIKRRMYPSGVLLCLELPYHRLLSPLPCKQWSCVSSILYRRRILSSACC